MYIPEGSTDLVTLLYLSVNEVYSGRLKVVLRIVRSEGGPIEMKNLGQRNGLL